MLKNVSLYNSRADVEFRQSFELILLTSQLTLDQLYFSELSLPPSVKQSLTVWH